VKVIKAIIPCSAATYGYKGCEMEVVILQDGNVFFIFHSKLRENKI
jgi:hypothetical protein